MGQYLVSIYRPQGYDGATESAEMGEAIDQLNREMVAAGIRRFVGGLKAPELARAVRRDAEGRRTVTDGPYIETREFIGGFWVLEVPDMAAALGWAEKAAEACRCSVEVRPFH